MNFIQSTKNPKNTENPVSNTGQAPGLCSPYVPLRPSADTLPAFPIHCLPPRLQSYVAAVAEHTQTPVDMAAGVALGVLATCLQGKVRVEGNTGHYEQTSLYVFIVANPGARKSAVIRAMTTVIEDYEQAYNERLKPQIRKRRQERETLQRQINRLNRQLEQKYDSMTELELQYAQDNLADLPAIQPLQIFTDDCTSEMMVKLLKDNGGRMALISAEGGAFDAIIGRYSKKPNLDVWLKGICGDTIRVDRLNREPDYVRHPAVSMILTAQPSVLSEIMQNGMLDGRGFLARFLYVNIPPTAAPRSFQSAPIPQDVQEDYKEFYYYGCKHRRLDRGHKCTFKTQIPLPLMDQAVAEVIVSLVSRPDFSKLMAEKINAEIDTTALQQEITHLEKLLRQQYAVKDKLMKEIDQLDPDDRHYQHRKSDLDDRLYKMYDKIDDTEELLIEARAKKQAIEADKVTRENIVGILTNFQRLYDVMNDAEKHDLMETLIADIQVYPQRQPNGQWLKSIHFKLPIIPEEEMQFGLDNSDRDETVMCFSKGTYPHRSVKVEFPLEGLNVAQLQGSATYEQIKAYVLEHSGLKVSTLYIAQVKQKYGILSRECYNKPKSEDAKQPQCPPDKEAAIVEALKFYGLIAP